MAFDPYDPCPCGSGKKLKFCCQSVVGEMEKVARLREGGQAQRAFEELEALAERHPESPWVISSLAAQLMDQGDVPRARELLHGVLRTTPDQPYALALLAALVFAVEGYEGTKPIFHRALQKSAGTHPNMVAQVALGIAAEMYETDRFLAAREHLALALRVVKEDEPRREVFVQLLEFEGNSEVPYPLRSVHQFAPFEGDEAQSERHALAVKLSFLGLWAEAAGVLAELAGALPDNAALQQNLGFCHAWDGNLPEAAKALHRAAELQEDFEAAVELEAIAQLLDLDATEDRTTIRAAEYEVPPLSQLLGELEERPECVRVEVPPDEHGDDRLSGMFYVLDREVSETPLTREAVPADVPEVLGQVILMDADRDHELPPRATITGGGDERFERVKEVFEAVLGDRGEPREGGSYSSPGLPTELQSLSWRWYFPPGTPVAVQRDLERRQWETVIDETWPSTSLTGLGGRSPADVAGSEDALDRVRLSAAVAVLDAHCNGNQYELDAAALRERYGLPASAPLEVDDETPLNALSSVQLARIPVGGLSDARLAELVNRGLLIRHNAFLRSLLTEVLDRPSCRETIDLDRCHQTLAELERNRFEIGTALEWVERGAAVQEADFERKLHWKLLELRFRLERLDDPGLEALLVHLWEYFGVKLPQLRDYLEATVRAAGIEPPWAGSTILTADSASGSTGGLWTPGAGDDEGGEAGGEKTLWVPGQ